MLRVVMALGLAFIYVPLGVVVINSFNALTPTQKQNLLNFLRSL